MALLTAGVDLGGTKIQTVVMADETVVGSARRLTPASDADHVIEEIIGAVREAITAAGATPGDLARVGIGTPGAVDVATGHVSRSSNVPGFMADVALGPRVTAAFGDVPVVVDNDVRAAVTGEHQRGAGRPYRNLLGVFVGTGVGGGLVLEGQMRRGRGSAGEIGHMIVRPGGRRCPCGHRGCLEAYAGRLSMESAARRAVEKGYRTKLFDIMERKGKDRLSSSVFADALDAGDRFTVELLQEAVEALGLAIASAQSLLDLEAVIVGGGLGDRLGEPFVRRVEKAMVKNLRLADHAPVVLATELGDLSGAVGAAVLAGG